MLVFWLLATLMTAVALAFVLVPLLRSRPAAGPSAVEVNLEVLRGQRREIEADLANGTLPADAREEVLAELVDRAQGDLEAAPGGPAAPRKPWIAAAVSAIAIPAIAFGVYHAVGMPYASDSSVASHEGAPMDQRQIAAMVDRLASKVRDRPDDAQGWALLARSEAALGRFKEAAGAYEHLSKLTPGDPQVLADYADALGMSQGRSLAGRPSELIQQALAVDPKHPKALALAGTAALDAGDFKGAEGYWQTLADELPPGSDDEAQVQSFLGEVRERAAAAGHPLPASAPPASTAAKPKAVASAGPKAEVAAGSATGSAPASGSVTGSVALGAAVASKVQGTDTLFIFARAENGPRMPLAVVRGTASQLPMRFALDDSQAMAPNMKLSGAAAVRIEARISRSGNAIPQPGDLVGTSAVVKPGARGVNIIVDKVVP
jgi:cytochrome c-type biogenesis protein CcmH